MVDEVVLDASALLALLLAEPGAELVARAIPGARISAVNLAEVATRLVAAGMPEPEARRAIDVLGLRVEPFAVDLAWRAAGLRASTRARGLSLGDRACLALAAREGLPAYTADRAWLDLGLPIAVRAIR